MSPDELVRVPFEQHVKDWQAGTKNRNERLTFVNAVVAHLMVGTPLRVDDIEEQLGPNIETHQMAAGTLRVYPYWDREGEVETEWVLLVTGEAGLVVEVSGNERRSFRHEK